MADSNMIAFAKRNARRYVFYTTPQGAATLTGLMSLTDPEETDGPKFEWFEQRFVEKRATTAPFVAASTGPWQNSVGVGGATIAFTMVTPGTTNRAKLKIASLEDMRAWNVGERITIHRQKNSTPIFVDVRGIVRAVDTTNSVLTIDLDAAITVSNDAAEYGYSVTSEGVANAEGSLTSNVAPQLWPINPYNHTQIWRTGMSWSGTSANQAMFFDIGGKGRSDRMDAARRHLIEIENSLIFGQRGSENVTMEDGTPSVKRWSGGIIWHLEQWQAANGGVALYRNGAAAVSSTPATANADDDCRIVTADTNGAFTNAEWKLFEERMFQTSMNQNNEKIGIGGSTAIAAICTYYENHGDKIRITRPYQDSAKLEFTFTTIETRYGTLHLKSHPRFNSNSALKRNLLLVDLDNIKFRPMVGRDTRIRENIQTPSFDGRKDEYFTEGGFEIRFPESHMYFKNMASIAIS